jgi:hypothetical protein
MYSIGTKLSSPDALGVVLTNDKVAVKTGIFAGQFISLDDWKILYEPPAVADKLVDAEQAESKAQPLVESKPAHEKRAIGTKMKWVLTPETYRVAIQTDKGILQVKSVTDGAGECHETGCKCAPCEAFATRLLHTPWNRLPLKKTLFEDEAAWRASLPQGGEVSVEGASIEKKFISLSSTTDVEKVAELCQRFNVYADIFEHRNTIQQLENMKSLQLKNDERFQTFKANPSLFSKSYSLRKFESWRATYAKWIHILTERIANSSVAENNVHTYSKASSGRARLFLTLADGTQADIWTTKNLRRVSQMSNTPLELSIFYNGKLYKSFKEFDIAMDNGKPILVANYRNKTINLSHLL